MKRLSDAAARFWPFPTLTKDGRRERVHTTFLEILEREARGEEHKISWWVKWMYRRTHDMSVKFSREVGVDDVSIYAGTERARQINIVAAHQALELVQMLPAKHRHIIELLAGGADLAEVAEETGFSIFLVMNLLKDARAWLADGGCYLARLDKAER